MNDDYLWDRSGPPDPEIERLERTLAPLRYRHRGDVLESRRTPDRRRWGLAVAAAVVLAAVALEMRKPLPTAAAWQVDSVRGKASLGNEQAAVAMSLRAGQTVRTASDTEISFRAEDFGTMQIGPDSELRATTDRRIELDRGLLHAYIWAPPRQFVVDTPSARAVDLGCQYTIQVDASGDGLLRVSMGWVAFQNAGQEAFIPEGAACVTRKRRGPGIPFYEDASEALRRGLAAFEQGDGDALGGILAAARPSDGLTLWHLLTRVNERDRGRVFDRFAELVKLPQEVSRDAVLRRDAHAIDLCWDALNSRIRNGGAGGKRAGEGNRISFTWDTLQSACPNEPSSYHFLFVRGDR